MKRVRGRTRGRVVALYLPDSLYKRLLDVSKASGLTPTTWMRARALEVLERLPGP